MRVKDGKTLGANHRDGGLHYDKTHGADAALLSNFSDPDLFVFPDNPLRLGLDGKVGGRDTAI